MASPLQKLFCFISLVFIISCSAPNFDGSIRRAEGLVGIGQYKKAIKIYERLIEKYPDHKRTPEVLLSLGDLYANSLGDLVRGLDIYLSCIEADPYSEAARLAHEKRADIFERKGLTQQLVEEYSALIKFFPKAEYRLRLGEAFIANKDYEQARVELGDFVERKDVPPEWVARVLFDMAESYYLEGQPKEAVKFYYAFLDKAPDSELVPEVQLRLASCFEEMGHLGLAQKFAKQALEGYPNKEVVKKRLEGINKRGKKPAKSGPKKVY